MEYFRRQTQLLRQNFFFRLLAIGLFFASPALASAAPGDIDMSFGSGGIVNAPLSVERDEFSSISVQPDGKIVASGFSWYYDKYELSEYPIRSFIARYNSSGTLDASFGVGGIVSTAESSSNSFSYVGSRSILQPDGKILAIGYRFINPSGFDFAVARYNSNGSPDTSFGAGGKVFTDLGDILERANDVGLQPDGKIVVIGRTGFSSFGLARYNSDGSLDASFGAGGKVITPMGNEYFEANSILLQPDGKIVLTGLGGNGSNDDIVLVRYNPDGLLDSSFGANGKVIHHAGGHEGASDSVLLPDGKILITGYGYTGSSTDVRTIIVRYNSNGSVDASFAANGIFRTEEGFYLGLGVVLQPDGKIISTGYAMLSGNSLIRFAVLRLNPTGTPDTTFGTNGKQITPIGANSSLGHAVALQADGKILVSGGTSVAPGGVGDAVIIRYSGDSVAPRAVKFDYDGDGKADISIFRPALGEWWYLRSSDGGNRAFQFGNSSDKIVPADFTGDGKTDVAFWRPSSGQWFILRSEDFSFFAFPFGTTGDVPVPADYDGDGKADAAVFRSSSLTWFIQKSSGGTDILTFGAAGDKPVVGDYDGDGKTDIAIFRPNGTNDAEWWIRRSSNGSVFASQFGTSTDKPVPGDYTGDGKTDVALWRPSNGNWFILRSEDFSFFAFPFGGNGDVPVAGDYDGDGKFDAGVFRPTSNTWFIQRSTAGTLIQQFGITGDLPTPSAFVP